MAEKRMFSKKIIDTDWFMDMPASTQNLYFHLSMRADDDGFVASPKRIVKLIGASEDDYKVLIAKKFIIQFDSGICVIKDWRINNYLRSDRYTETIYKQEKSLLKLNENNEYELGIPLGIPSVSTVYSNSNTNTNTNTNTNSSCNTKKEEVNEKEDKEKEKQDRKKVEEPTKIAPEVKEIYDYWQSKHIKRHQGLSESIEKAIKQALKQYSIDTVKQGIDRYEIVLHDKDYFFDTIWGLDKFLKQGNALSDFIGDGDKWASYQNKKQTQRKSNKQSDKEIIEELMQKYDEEERLKQPQEYEI